MTAARRPGTLGALVDETGRAVSAFTALLDGLDAAAWDAPRQDAGELRTIRDVAEHVRAAAAIYENMQRAAFGLPAAPPTPAPADPAALRADLEGLPARAWSLLEDRADWDDDQLAAVRMAASWGQVFDLEQLLEHALAHLWRHLRQLEGWLAAGDGSAARDAGTVRGETAAVAYLASAEWYDRLYQFKDYAGEAARVERIVRERLPGARTLLDVACGTGRHLEHLRARFACEGLDLSPGQLAEARRRLPEVPLHQGDMRDADLGRAFDVVCCLFSAIGYMTTLADLARACATLARHARPGGLVLVEPWLDPAAWRPGTVHGLFVDEPALKIARINTSRTVGRRAILDFHHLVGTPEGVEHQVERHELLLATRAELRAALEGAGLETDFDEEGLSGRGLWIGRRR